MTVDTALVLLGAALLVGSLLVSGADLDFRAYETRLARRNQRNH